MVSPKQRQLPCPNLPPFPPWAAEAAPPSVLLSERTAQGYVLGASQRAQFRALAGLGLPGLDRCASSRPTNSGPHVMAPSFILLPWWFTCGCG